MNSMSIVRMAAKAVMSFASRPRVLAALAVVAALGSPLASEAASVDMLSCAPGQDSATEARFVWLSDVSSSCDFYYSLTSGTSGTKVTPTCAAHSCTFVNKVNDSNVYFTGYYRYTAELAGLQPDTTYYYWVTIGGNRIGNVQKFKTGSTGTNFKFMWLSDVHTDPGETSKTNNVATILGKAKTAAGGDFDFVIFSGDAVKYGNRYNFWQQWNWNQPFSDYTTALLPGNKEYYEYGKGYTDTDRIRHYQWFMEMRNNPANGATGVPPSYWFLRNGVLFVMIDSLFSEGRDIDSTLRSKAVKAQTEWFDRVATEQQGKYQYIVAVQHYPYLESSGICDYGHCEEWFPVFTKHQVDFALSGDSHQFARSKPLKSTLNSGNLSNTICALDSSGRVVEGTVYIVTSEIPNSPSSFSVKDGTGIIDKIASGGGSNGAGWFEVNTESMTYHNISWGGAEVDAVTVKAKRPPVSYDAPAAFTWKGGYDGSRIGSDRNWEEGVAPSANSGATLNFPFASNTTVTNDYASLSAKKIVFPASTYRASFVGGPVSVSESIVNQASVTNKFKSAVTFAGAIDVTGEMDFAGGVTGTVPANHTTYRGQYNLTTTGDWTPPSGSVVPSGSELSMPGGTLYGSAGYLMIERNATVAAGSAKMNKTSSVSLLLENDGVFKTTGVLTSSGTSSAYHYLVSTAHEAASEGLIALGGLKIDGSAIVYANSYGGRYQMAIGDNGIKKKQGAAGYFLIRNDNQPELIGSWCNGNDYKIAVVDANGAYPLDTQEYVIYGSRTDRTYNINFDTTDCFNAGVKNTIRDMSPICGADPAKVSVGICGAGTFRFENTAVNASGLYSGGTAVSNAATVAILKGSCPGRGGLSLRDTATLSLPDSASGTANVFGTLDAGAGTRIEFLGLSSGTTPLSVGGLAAGTGTKPVIAVNASGLADGTYPLIASASASSATAASFTLSASGVASGKTASLEKSGNTISLKIAASGSGGGGTVVPVGDRIIGVWDHYGEGLYNKTRYADTVADLRAAGITDVYIDYKVHKNVTSDGNGGFVYGNGSKFLKAELGNYVNAASGTGLRVHAWFACFRSEGESNGISPGNTAHREYLISNIVDVIENYNVDGIHLDYCRWIGSTSSSDIHPAVLTEFVEEAYTRVKAEARQRGRDIAFSVAVFPKQNKTYDGITANSVGQAWRQWIDDGIVDYVVPMNYASQMTAYTEPDGDSNPGYAEYMAIDSDTPEHAVHVVSGIGIRTSSCTNDWPVVSEQIDAAVAAGLRGYSFFDLTTDDYFKTNTLPNLVEANGGGIHGKWVGGAGDNRFSVAANWDDGIVPSAGDALDFSSVTSATTINADVNAAFGAVTMGTGVVTFTGGLTASSFSDTSKVAVGANATVTLDGDLVYTATTGGGWMLNRLDGTFVVTGKIVVSGTADMKLAQTVGASGVAVARGLVSNGGTSWTFRLNRSDSGDTARWVIGEDGLSGTSGFWMLANATSSSAVLQPYTNDFTIADWIGARSGPSLTVNTTGWGDNAGHVMTATAGFIREGRVAVTGNGSLVCDFDATSGAYGQSAHAVPYDVADGATLALKKGAKPGTGTITQNEGSTLAFPDSATGGVVHDGTLELKAGANLALGGLSAGVVPVTTKLYNIRGEVAVTFAERPAPGRYTILAATGQSLSADHASRLSVADPDLAPACSFYIADGNKVMLRVVNRISVVNRATSLALTGDDEIVGAGGVILPSLAIPDGGRLVLDPINTPVRVDTAPTFGSGAKIALSSAYAGMSLGKIVLMTYSGEAGFTQALFDASSVAPGASCALYKETAPDGVSKQMVLYVGRYDADAKEIVVAAAGDSITQGVRHSSRGDSPQYRTSIAARLAAAGYKPKFRGIWRMSDLDAAGVRVPDDWAYHSGFGYAAIRTSTTSGGLLDNMPLYLDIAGYPDVITLLIGTNDMGTGRTGEDTYADYVTLVNATAAQRPGAKIIGATVLRRSSNVDLKVQAFNELLRAEYAKPGKGDLPDNFFLLDLYPILPYSNPGTYKDTVHPDWAGDAIVAEAFADKIAEVLPLASFAGAGDASVTDAPQSALGVAGVAATEEGASLAAYTNGMIHVFTVEKDGAAGATNCFTSAPYTWRAGQASLSRQIRKVGYYMELVRKGTDRRRWVWVDMDATDKTLGDVDFPWDDAKMQYIARKLHVKSNYFGIHDVAPDDDSVSGIVEGTKWNYGTGAGLEGAPDDVFGSDKYGWNDTMGSSGGHACFQVHRIFSQTGADVFWNNAEVLFAWNCWGSAKQGSVDEIGIGTFAAQIEAASNKKCTDYTTAAVTEGNLAAAISSDAYSVRRLEIWAEFAAPARHGVWSGDSGDFDDPSNWEDGLVPAAGEALYFDGLTSAATVSVTGASKGRKFGLATMGQAVVTFTGEIAFAGISDTEKVAVAANATVTLDGNLLFSNDATRSIVHSVASNGKFVVTGKLGLSADAQAGLNPQTVTDGGLIVAGELVNNAAVSSKWIYSVNQSGSEPWSQKWIIGPGGITSESASGLWGLSDAKNSAYFYPNTNDFTVSAPTVLRTNFGHYELNTTGFGDGLPHVITLDAGFSDNGKLFIAGTGKVVVNHVTAAFGGKGAFSGMVDVSNSATLAINAGKQLTSGGIYLHAGTTLALPDSASGGVTHTGLVQFRGGTRLVVGGLSSGVVPLTTSKLDIILSEGDGTKVTLSKDGVAPAPGTYTLIAATGQTLQDAHASRLVLDDPALDGYEVTFALGGANNKSILVTIAPRTFWPAAWNGGAATDAAMQAAFDEWAKDNDYAAANGEAAFLLGENIAEYKPLKLTDVSLDGAKFTIGTNTDLTKVNGRLYVLVGESLATIETTGTKITGTVGDVTKLVNIDASAPIRFFKVGIDY